MSALVLQLHDGSKKKKHEVFSVYDLARGLSDNEILEKANRENWILITNDNDFGEIIFRDRHSHRGVIFLRLSDKKSPSKIKAIERLLNLYSDHLIDHFVVVNDSQVRFGQS